jgi:UDP-N-acetylglucosamine 2-epimerase (non-hydrolysing)
MVITFYGTSAELIKMYGIIKGIPRDQQLLICTAQQYAGLQKVHKQLSIEPDMYLAKGWKKGDVENMKQMLGLMLVAHGNFAKQFAKIKKIYKESDKKHGTKSIVLVHGDTLTTVVGAYLGRSLRLPVAHIEAGLRSGSWKSPFPEELDRRAVAKIARIHFPPSETAQQALLSEKTKGEIIPTTYNTAKDAIEQADKFVSAEYKKLKLPKSYTLVLLHRTELLENKADLEAILKTIRSHAESGKNLVFTEHTTTREKVESLGFSRYLKHPNITVIHKQPYFDFMAIVKAADAVLTDGGGLQEDSFFLGIPAIIHRARTERQDGLGLNATLSKMDVSAVDSFLKNHPNKSKFTKLTSKVSPSKVVVDYLTAHNFYK